MPGEFCTECLQAQVHNQTAAEFVSCSNHPFWNKPGDQEAGVTFRFAHGAWWVFDFVFKDEEFYPDWVGMSFFCCCCCFFLYFRVHYTMSVWLQHPLKFGLLFQYFFISHNPGAGLKNTTKDRHKILKDSTL